MSYPNAKVICDSISPAGVRITTLEITMHRFVLAEFNTHRMLSRNSASSRAIPVEKMLARYRDEPAYPISWPTEQPGMQGGAELEDGDLVEAKRLFKAVHDSTLLHISEYLVGLGYKYGADAKAHRLHKSVINRLLEPMMWHTVVATATCWDNYFDLRCHELAQPEIRVASELARKAMNLSVPNDVPFGDWHLPYVLESELASNRFDWLDLARISSARCARVSTMQHDRDEVDVEADFALCERLMSAEPMHASPFEHPAMPLTNDKFVANFKGWVSYRSFIEHQKGVNSRR